MKKYSVSIIMLAIFEAVAVTLWLAKDNIFYLFNFSYIGCSIALGTFLYAREYKYARRVVQLLVGDISWPDLRGEHADRGLLVLPVHGCF